MTEKQEAQILRRQVIALLLIERELITEQTSRKSPYSVVKTGSVLSSVNLR
jgi:hypothetical protein